MTCIAKNKLQVDFYTNSSKNDFLCQSPAYFLLETLIWIKNFKRQNSAIYDKVDNIQWFGYYCDTFMFQWNCSLNRSEHMINNDINSRLNMNRIYSLS